MIPPLHQQTLPHNDTSHPQARAPPRISFPDNQVTPPGKHQGLKGAQALLTQQASGLTFPYLPGTIATPAQEALPDEVRL